MDESLAYQTSESRPASAGQIVRCTIVCTLLLIAVVAATFYLRWLVNDVLVAEIRDVSCKVNALSTQQFDNHQKQMEAIAKLRPTGGRGGVGSAGSVGSTQ